MIGGIYFLIMITVLGALAFYFSQRIESDNMATMMSKLRGQARLGADLLAFARDREDAKQTLRRIHFNVRARRVALLRLDGTAIAELPDNARPSPNSLSPTRDPEVQDAIENGMGEDIRFDAEAGEQIAFIAARINIKQPMKPGLLPAPKNSPRSERHLTQIVPHGVLVLAAPLTEVQESISHLRTAVIFTFLGILLLLFVINAGVSYYISQPLATLSAAAERFASGDLDERLQPAGAMEIASLGESFQRMASQLRGTISGLAEERAQAEAIFTSMVDGVLVTDLYGKIRMVNQTAEHICGVAAEDIIGTMLTDTLPHPVMHEMLLETLETGEPNKHEMMLADEIERIVEVHLAPVVVDGRPIGLVIVLYDITHIRKLEQIRRDFVANVSHELRTPVASIRAMAETLADAGGEDPELEHDFLKTIIGESERLTSLLDDLLQLSSIESGHRHLKLEPTNICEIIRHVAERVVAPITAKQQHLTLDIPDELLAIADHDALVQILLNLLVNAQKYSPEGSQIRVWTSRNAYVCIHVSDTGVGIPPSDLERVFERFYRVDKARSRAVGGTGLGLAIVKHLVDLHGGRISVESELGRGSTFTIELPAEQ